MTTRFKSLQNWFTRTDPSGASWRWWSCATVLLLLATTIGQREYQLFRRATEAPAPAPPDFGVYYVAGRVALGEGNGRLYSTPPGPTQAERARQLVLDTVPLASDWSRIAARTMGTRVTYYTYPPFFAWLFSPLARLSPRVAYFLWRSLSTAMLVFSTYLILRSFRPRPDLATFLIATVGGLSFFPFNEVLYEGQVGCLILFLWTLGFYCMRTRRIAASAGFFAVGTLVKITPAIVAPILLLRRQWKWLISYSAAMAALLAASIWRLGWESHWIYLTQVFPSLSAGIEGYPLKSLATVVRNLYLGHAIFTPTDPWQIPSWLRVLITIANLALFAGVLFYLLKQGEAGEDVLSQELAIAALLSLMISPLTWRHHYVLALLPLLCAWMHARECASNARLAGLAVITLSLGTPFADFLLVRMHPNLLQALLSSAFLIGSFILLDLSLQDQRRIGEPAADAVPHPALAA